MTTDIHKVIKNLKFDVTIGSVGTPGDPGQKYIPPQPARCRKQPAGSSSEQVCGWEVIESIIGDAPASITGPTRSYEQVYVCRPASSVVSEVCTPAHPGQPYRPPTPARPPTPTDVRNDYNLGWNGRAYSMAIVGATRAGYASFSAKKGMVSAFVGFTYHRVDTGYADIRYGFFLDRGRYKVVNNGVIVGPSRPYTEDASEFRLLLTDGFFEASVIGASHDSGDVHTSDDPDMFTANYRLSVCLYAADDFVYDPVFRAATQGAVELSLQAIGGSAYAMGGAVMEPLTAWGISAGFPTDLGFTPTGPFSYAVNSLSELESVASEGAYAGSTTVLPALTSEATAGLLEPSFGHGIAMIADLASYGTGLTGEIGGGTATLPALASLSSEGAYGFSENTLAPLAGYAHAYEGNNNGFLYSFVGVEDTMTAPAELYVSLDASGAVLGAWLAQLTYTGSLTGSASVAASMTAGQLINTLLVSEAVVIDTAAFRSLLDHEIWVMNRTTEAFTRYEQRHFEAVAFYNGETYGVRSDGVYRVGGDTDDEEPIEASVNFGENGFGTSALKRIDGAYMGLSSDGTMYLRVTANGSTYTYAARNADSILRTQRFDVGRGMKASFVGFELVNSDGADFEVDGVEFMAVPLTRRIR